MSDNETMAQSLTDNSTIADEQKTLFIKGCKESDDRYKALAFLYLDHFVGDRRSIQKVPNDTRFCSVASITSVGTT